MRKKPFSIWLLTTCLVVLGLGGFYGGGAMLVDPTGAALGMDVMLSRLPVDTYVLPGLFLVSCMGLVPLVLAYSVVQRPAWSLLSSLFAWSNHHWSWAATIMLSVVIGIWLALQAAYIGFTWPMQWFIAAIGAINLVIVCLPSVADNFRSSNT